MQEFELSVGDTIIVGGVAVTVVDIDGPDVSFRIDSDGDNELISVLGNRTESSSAAS